MMRQLLRRVLLLSSVMASTVVVSVVAVKLAGQLRKEIAGIDAIIVRNETTITLTVRASIDENVLQWRMEPGEVRQADVQVMRDAHISLLIVNPGGSQTVAQVGYLTPGLGKRYRVLIRDSTVVWLASSWL